MKISSETRLYYRRSLPNNLLRVRKEKGYYFNSDGVYCCESLEDLYRKGMYGIIPTYDYRYRAYNLYKPDFKGISPRIVSRAITSLKEGDTISKFFEYLETLEPNERQELPTGLDRFITKISLPSIQREYGNKNTKTFDFIYVYVCIIHDWESDRKQYIKENMPEIKKRVIARIEESKHFQRYGIPINFLKLTSITLTRDDVLHFIFELKIK